MGMKICLRGEKPVTNRLSYITAYFNVLMKELDKKQEKTNDKI
jgi:hypothetical protein